MADELQGTTGLVCSACRLPARECQCRGSTFIRPEEQLYDVQAAVYELDGNGSDGAYDLLFQGATADEIADELRKVLKSAWGLANSKGPFRLSIQIGPAGRGDDLPLG